MKIKFVLASSVDPNEILHYAAFHLGIHCLPKYLFGGFSLQWVNLFVCVDASGIEIFRGTSLACGASGLNCLLVLTLVALILNKVA